MCVICGGVGGVCAICEVTQYVTGVFILNMLSVAQLF